MEQSKITFVRQCEDAATKLAQLSHIIEDIQKIWDSRLYGPGAENAFSDAELAILDGMGYRSCTADELYAFIIFCAQYQNFVKGAVAAQSDYAATLNKLRTDM